MVDDIEETLAEMRETIAGIDALTASARERQSANAAADTAEAEQQAARRRQGDDGKDWQALQQRIDLKKTTLTDILTGVDLSQEARAVRALAEKHLPALRRQYEAIVEEAEKSGEFAELDAARSSLARARAELDAADLDL